MTDDVKVVIRHIRVSANEWVRVYGNMEYPPNLKLAIMAADALEAATVAPAVDREALARAIAGGDAIFYHPQRALAFMKADEIFASGLLRDVRDVQAEALEEAAGAMYGDAVVLGGVPGWLRARAQAIREARSED